MGSEFNCSRAVNVLIMRSLVLLSALLALLAVVTAHGLYPDDRELVTEAERIFDRHLRAAPRSVEDDCGNCGVGYQACCVGYALAGDPCNCLLGFNAPFGYDCGDCGIAYDACCLTSKLFGSPCTCPIGPN